MSNEKAFSLLRQMPPNKRTVWKVNSYLALYGTREEIEESLKVLNEEMLRLLGINKDNEREARILLQRMIDQGVITAEVLFDGNLVFSKKRIIENIKEIIKSGDMHRLNDYTYKFLINACGSIAHFDKEGWIGHYPTVNHLRKFFLKNEYGKRVLKFQPYWAGDRIEIIKEIEALLGIRGKKDEG